MDAFQTEIETIFADEEQFQYDIQGGQGHILPALAMWAAVAPLDDGAILLEREIPLGWKERYLAAFDAYAATVGKRPKNYPAYNVSTADKAYLRERRKVIIATFDAFLAITEDPPEIDFTSPPSPAPEVAHE